MLRVGLGFVKGIIPLSEASRYLSKTKSNTVARIYPPSILSRRKIEPGDAQLTERTLSTPEPALETSLGERLQDN
jgi:hypothetical protein